MLFALELASALLNGGYALGLAYRKRWAWPLGFFGTLAAVEVLFEAKLYAESALNLGYAILAVYGWFSWRSVNALSSTSSSRLQSLIASLMLAGIVAFVMVRATDNPRPILDAVMFSGGILGTWWQARRDRANWLLWIALNVIGSGLYADRGLWIYAAYSTLMAFVSVWGWVRWKDAIKTAPTSQQ